MARGSFRWRGRGAAALAAAVLLGACTDSGEEITDVPFVTFNSAIAPVGTGLPTGAMAAVRYGTLTGAGALASEDSLVLDLDLQNLETLAGNARYQLWLSTADGITELVGDYVQLRITVSSPAPGEFVEDTAIVSSEEATSTFAGGPATDIHHFSAVIPSGDARLGSAAPHVLISIEGAGGAAAPADARPLWAALPGPFDPEEPGGEVDGTSVSAAEDGAVLFGRFDADDPAASRAFGASGTGLMSVRKEGGDFVSLIGQLEELPLPPVGYRYASWLVSDASEVDAGAVTSPPPDPVPLDEADRVAIGGARPAPVVLPTGILDARTQVSREEAGSAFGAFQQYRITLEPKLGVEAQSPTVVLAAAIPEAVIALHQQQSSGQ